MSDAERPPYDGLLCMWCLQTMMIPASDLSVGNTHGRTTQISTVRQAREQLGNGEKQFVANNYDNVSVRADTMAAGDAVCASHLHLSMRRLPLEAQYP